MVRTASAVWTGDLKSGQGHLDSASGVLKSTPYSFHTRFEDGAGTNPEELVGAAHAGCFSMACSAGLGKAGFTAEEIRTVASVTLEPVDGNMTVTKIHLETTAKVPGIAADQFNEIMEATKKGCPISRLLNCEITLSATLV